MPKKKRTGGKTVQCDKCNVEFTPEKIMQHPDRLYVYKGKAFCADCLIEMGVMPDSAEPYQVYLETLTDQGKFGPGMAGT